MIAEADVYKIGTLTRTHGVRGEVAFQFSDDVWDRVEADYLFLRLDGLLVPFFLEEWRFRSDSVALLKFEDIDSADSAQALVGADIFFPKALTPSEIDEEDLTWQHFIGFEVRPTPRSAQRDARYFESPSREGRGVAGAQPTSDSEALPLTGERGITVPEGSSHSEAAKPSAPEGVIGTVTAVYDQTSNVLLEVTTPDGHEILIPAHEDFILRADHRERRLYVSVPDELLTLNR